MIDFVVLPDKIMVPFLPLLPLSRPLPLSSLPLRSLLFSVSPLCPSSYFYLCLPVSRAFPAITFCFLLTLLPLPFLFPLSSIVLFIFFMCLQVIELNPFGDKVGPGLFDWEIDQKQLYFGPFECRVIADINLTTVKI